MDKKSCEQKSNHTPRSEFELLIPPSPDFESQKPLNLPCLLLDRQSGNDDFCGRSDILDRLANELLPSKASAAESGAVLRQFALCGFGGIGKTEVAREFARRHRSVFDAVLWVSADEVAKLEERFQQISLALGLEDQSESKSQIVSRELVKHWLSNPRSYSTESDGFVRLEKPERNISWLLIFDNADDPEILADYWPQGNGSVLITSRDPSAKMIHTDKPSGMDLGPLTQMDSISLLKHLISSNEKEDDATQQISVALGGVPLAISQMAAVICQEELTLLEFIELYSDREQHFSLYETTFDTSLTSYRHSLSTVWAIEKLKPQTRQLLELISFLDPDVIDEALLVDAYAKLFEEEKILKSDYIHARIDLLQLSLVQRDDQKQRISVHRVVQDVVMAAMDPFKKTSLFDQIVRILWVNWPSAMPKPSKEPTLPKPKSSGGRLHVGRWPVCALIYPHVLRMHQLWPAIRGPSEATKLQFAQLLTEAAWYQKERGRTKKFDGFFVTAQEICESSTHPDRCSLLANIHFCLGSIAMDVSDFNTSRVHKERSLELVYDMCQELGIEVDERLYLAYAERGISRIQDARYKEGEDDLKEALRINKTLGNYVPRSGEANLSYSLLAQGKLDECNTLLLDSLAGREKALGKDDRESVRTGLILYVLGNLRAKQDKWEESLEYHTGAWRHMLATVGERDFYTANVAHKLAEHHLRSGQMEEAIVMTNKALEIWSIDPSSRRNEIARTTFFKSKVFEAMGKTAKASIALRVASRLRKEITKEDREMKSLVMTDFDEIVAFWAC